MDNADASIDLSNNLSPSYISTSCDLSVERCNINVYLSVFLRISYYMHF